MFETISERLGNTLKNLRGQGRLTEDNIATSLREVRMALLEADVALPVVKDFISHVRERALGKEVMSSLTPGQAVIRIVNQELVQLMGESNVGLELNTQPPAVILVAGLQGAGKTTSVAKMARYLKENEKRKVAVVSCDIYRPAAIDQLQTLAGEIGVECIPSHAGQEPAEKQQVRHGAVRQQVRDRPQHHGRQLRVADDAFQARLRVRGPEQQYGDEHQGEGRNAAPGGRCVDGSGQRRAPTDDNQYQPQQHEQRKHAAPRCGTEGARQPRLDARRGRRQQMHDDPQRQSAQQPRHKSDSVILWQGQPLFHDQVVSALRTLLARCGCSSRENQGFFFSQMLLRGLGCGNGTSDGA